MAQALDMLADRIAACRRCDSAGLPVHHPVKLYRGLGLKRLMLVGVQPGNTEKTSGQAFSGNAGYRLMQWMAAADVGNTREEVFENAYITSVLKCATDDRLVPQCAEHCFFWLEEQIRLVRPRCLITLGKVPFQLLFNSKLGLDDLVGRAFREEELTQRMFPLLPEGCLIVPLPHPSGMSRWPNLPANREKIAHAMAIVREVIHE